MIRNLLATTAIATLVATGAFAQTTTPTAPADPSAQGGATTAPETPMVIKAEGNLASDIIGQTVYNSTSDDAENIGKVNDIVIGPDGNIQAVVIGVGGFLGIGEKDVAIEYNLVQWQERDNDRFMVVETNREALEALQEFDEAAYRPMPADSDVTETKPATAEDLAAAAPAQDDTATEGGTDNMAAAPTDDQATGTDQQDTAAATDDQAATDQQETAAAPADQPATGNNMAAAPTDDQAAGTDQQETAQAPADDEAAGTDQTQTGAIDRSQLQERPIDQITSEDFVGTTVYGANDEEIGEIGDVVLAPESQDVDAVLVDVGGFLGIGEKQVALGMDNLQFMTDQDGNLYLYTNLTKEQLEAQPAYEESGYAENRDEMRMNVPAMQ